MNEVQENKVEETSNENEFVVKNLMKIKKSLNKKLNQKKKNRQLFDSQDSDEHESYSEKMFKKELMHLTAKRKAAEDDANAMP